MLSSGKGFKKKFGLYKKERNGFHGNKMIKVDIYMIL